MHPIPNPIPVGVTVGDLAAEVMALPPSERLAAVKVLPSELQLAVLSVLFARFCEEEEADEPTPEEEARWQSLSPEVRAMFDEDEADRGTWISAEDARAQLRLEFPRAFR
jgi:hypothetical protein